MGRKILKKALTEGKTPVVARNDIFANGYYKLNGKSYYVTKLGGRTFSKRELLEDNALELSHVEKEGLHSSKQPREQD